MQAGEGKSWIGAACPGDTGMIYWLEACSFSCYDWPETVENWIDVLLGTVTSRSGDGHGGQGRCLHLDSLGWNGSWQGLREGGLLDVNDNGRDVVCRSSIHGSFDQALGRYSEALLP